MTKAKTFLRYTALLPIVALAAGCGADEAPAGGGVGGHALDGDARHAASSHGSTTRAAGAAVDALGEAAGGPPPLGSDWHPDPDGDGIETPSDACPSVYDPDNRASSCDPATDAPEAGRAIDDLRAEHVTPYGAWLTFRSNETSPWGYYADVAYSATPGEVGTAAGFAAAAARGDGTSVRVNERLGDAIPVPVVVTRMAPGVRYEVAVRDGAGRIGKILRITTLPEPRLVRPTAFPRVYATEALLADLRARAAAGDPSFARWRDGLLPKIERASTGSDIEDEKYCAAAALAWHVGHAPRVLEEARALHGKLVVRFEAGDFSGNGYRWADAALATCTDLLWNELDASTRERAIGATLLADERAAFELPALRLDDTDEAHSSIRTWLVDGLVGCDAPGVSQATSVRACRILDAGMRLWHGWMLVQARRDRGFLALSGGHMPDSTRYAQGSSLYWAQSFWVMHNQGFPVADYAPWIVNNLLATYLEPTTPRRQGLAAYGDIDRYQVSPSDPEPNSCPIDTFHFDVLALQMGLLARAGRSREAGWARHYLAEHGGDDVYQSRVHMLMFDNDAIAPVHPRAAGTEAPRAYVDSGFGMLYDRTSWGEGASLLTFKAGWSGVDHSQEDQGGFGFYRRGRWLTHASLAYEGEATHAQGHNVLQLGVLYNRGEERAGQYAFRNNGASAIVRRSTSPAHAYAHGELTGAYQSGFTAYYAWASVERALLWLKGGEQGGADALVVYDRVEAAPSAAAGAERSFQIHLDAAPSVSGRTASVELDGVGARQRVDVTAVLPAGATLAVVPPSGPPGNGGDAIYTHRLIVRPNSADETLRMVNVLSATDATATPTAVSALDVGDFVGAKLDGRAVLFPKERVARAGAARGPVSFDLPTGVSRAYVVGLVPGATYAFAATASASGTRVSLGPGRGVAADGGGVLALDL